MKLTWAFHVRMRLKASDAFGDELERQLAEQFAAATGLDIVRDGFTLVGPEPLVYDADGTGSVEANIVGPDGHGLWVMVAWQSGQGSVQPGDVPPGDIRFRWAELPVDELRAAYAGPAGPPWAVSDEFPYHPEELPFTVEWQHFAWPDLRITIVGSTPWGADDRAVIDAALLGVHEAWNRAANSEAGQGVIHSMEPSHDEGGAAVTVVDFGSSGPRVLTEIFAALAHAALSRPVARIVVSRR